MTSSNYLQIKLHRSLEEGKYAQLVTGKSKKRVAVATGNDSICDTLKTRKTLINLKGSRTLKKTKQKKKDRLSSSNEGNCLQSSRNL